MSVDFLLINDIDFIQSANFPHFSRLNEKDQLAIINKIKKLLNLGR